MIKFVKFGHVTSTSTGLYRSCAALASFSGTSDLILYDTVNFELIVENFWFGLDRWFGKTDKINGLWYALVWMIKFGLIRFSYSTEKQIN